MLQSVGITYVPEEDRLRIDIRAKDGAESSFLLTRRVCAAWLRDLEAMAVKSAQVPEHVDPAIRTSIASAHHSALAQQAKYGHSRQEAAERLPDPSLLSRIGCGVDRRSGQWALRFFGTKNQVVTLSLSPQTFHGVVELLRKQLAATDWGLQLLPRASAPDQEANKASGVLH
jgi:hypothetical protein